MKCILCKMCESAKAAIDKKLNAWLNTQTNTMTIWEQEVDQERIHRAHDLLKSEPAESFKEYLALAEQGSLWSMFNVGVAFETGMGTLPDLAQAEKWFRRAYEGGMDVGLIRLGHLYVKSREYKKAEDVFRTGIEHGLVPAMSRLAWTYLKSGKWPQKQQEVLVLLERASAAGDLSARRFLASAMLHGWFGLRRIPEGFRLIFKVADDIAELIKDEESVTPKSNNSAQHGFFNFLARLCPLGAIRIPA